MIILGSTGMLGQAIFQHAKQKKINVIGIARKNADINLDITDTEALIETIRLKKPKIIINCVAIVDLQFCEENIEVARLVNTKLVADLVNICKQLDVYLVHISSDHFFLNDKNKQHDENYPVELVNQYAKTKYSGERLALNYKKSLVIRTNVVGFRGVKGKPTFIEWALYALKNNQRMTLFNDFYTSSIDVYSFAYYLFLLVDKQVTGLINLASCEVSNKAVFVKKLADKFNLKMNDFNVGSVGTLPIKRANSLGLDVAKIEKELNVKMPTLDVVIDSLYINK